MFYPIHIITFLVSAALSTLVSPEAALDRATDVYAHVCEEYPTMADDTGSCSWRISACGEGVIYRDPQTEQEVFIPWTRIVHWRMDAPGPSTNRSDPQATFRLKLTESSRALFDSRASHDFIICGTSDDRRDLERTLRAQLNVRDAR